MTEAEMDERLAQLRQGFDLAIEKVLREKARADHPIVVADERGVPSFKNARHALADFLKKQAKDA